MRKYIIAIAGILLLAVNANAAFPVDEAGIAAYVRVGNTIELNKTIFVYEEILNINNLDIIGKVNITNEVENSIPLVYVGADGWIVAYYLKSEPESRIVQWWGSNRPIIQTTTLADAISKMVTALGVSYDSIKGNITYYDFKYPEANGMMMLAEENYGTDSFSLFIRDNLTLYSASFSHYCDSGKLDVDGTTVSELWAPYNQYAIRYSLYNISLFTKNKFHTVNLKADRRGCHASTLLIYRND